MINSNRLSTERLCFLRSIEIMAQTSRGTAGDRLQRAILLRYAWRTIVLCFRAPNAAASQSGLGCRAIRPQPEVLGSVVITRATAIFLWTPGDHRLRFTPGFRQVA